MNLLIPAGVVHQFCGANAPEGYLFCDGAVVSRATYAHLYSVVGDAFGNGDGSTTFHLPDMRGRFARGTDNMGSGAAARDPNSGTRTASNSGGNTGNSVGSSQSDATAKNGLTATSVSSGSHSHNLVSLGGGSYTSVGASGPVSTAVGGTPPSFVTDSAGSHTHGITVGAGDNETRPLNINMNYIVKF